MTSTCALPHFFHCERRRPKTVNLTFQGFLVERGTPNYWVTVGSDFGFENPLSSINLGRPTQFVFGARSVEF